MWFVSASVETDARRGRCAQLEKAKQRDRVKEMLKECSSRDRARFRDEIRRRRAAYLQKKAATATNGGAAPVPTPPKDKVIDVLLRSTTRVMQDDGAPTLSCSAVSFCAVSLKRKLLARQRQCERQRRPASAARRRHDVVQLSHHRIKLVDVARQRRRRCAATNAELCRARQR